MKGIAAGIESFEEMISNNYYYVDKTMIIKDLLEPAPAKVTLFTRPRRFGKSLTISMLDSFLNIEKRDTNLFQNLKISEDISLCDKYMHRFPVITLSFKDAVSVQTDQGQVTAAVNMLKNTIGMTADRFSFLLHSSRLSPEDIMDYRQLITRSSPEKGETRFVMSYDVLAGSLQTLSSLLKKHYGVPAVILIDEYDVPLDKAFHNGYYDDLIPLYRVMLSNAMKTNSSLAFAVLTGCLKISKESIFTGLNNLTIYDVVDYGMDEYFGFTEEEVNGILQYYQLSEYQKQVKDFYDGYQFGTQQVYNPWAVNQFVKNALDAKRRQREPIMISSWINTSGNEIIRRLLQTADEDVKLDLHDLSAGHSIRKKYYQTLTYPELYDSPDTIWTAMLHTGYLTCKNLDAELNMNLRIPNEEVQRAFDEAIRKWTIETVQNGSDLSAFCLAVETLDARQIEKALNVILRDIVSIRDTATKAVRENYYHGILNCAVSYRRDWIRNSNPESGDGYCDICIEDRTKNVGIIFELKYAEKGNFPAALAQAEYQIYTCRYPDLLESRKTKSIYLFGMAFYRKECRVRQVQYPRPS